MLASKNDADARRKLLRSLGGSATSCDELLHYNTNHFDVGRLPPPPVLPLADESHVADWRRYAAEAAGDVFGYLRARLRHLSIPIAAGVSATPAYAAAVRRGEEVNPEAFGGIFSLERPAELKLTVHEHEAGALPVLLTCYRPDFERLTQALAFRNEPRSLNSAVNAQMISGLINWDRVHRYRAWWIAAHGSDAWPAEQQRVADHEKWRFYDRLILACALPYSDVREGDLNGNSAAKDWANCSTMLRLTHEFTHYATKRLYDYMGTNILDEIICDWAAITAVLGHFDADWGLRFLGLEAWPHTRPAGRIHAYRLNLSDEAFTLACSLTVHAVHSLKRLSDAYYRPDTRRQFFLALTQLTLEGLVKPEWFEEVYDWATTQVS